VDYRREVDGLRALAVLPVIFFHAGFEIFSGGFIGVDVFFVISGYLITSIILAELTAGKFSVSNFYERRARRILPALFFVTVACIPFAWMWLLPSEMKGFSQSLAAVSVFGSNVLFWRQSGYFDTAAELKPLLHTWSLAVEEQFYVLFPLFLMLAWRLGKKWIVALLATVSFASLGVAHWGALNKPAATFFLLPTRGWELAIGAFIAFYFSRKERTDLPAAANQLLSLAGLALVVFGIFAFSKATPFPSLYALVPTVGAALIILFARPQTVVGTLLGSKAFVGIGLISYSAYLWHQPLFAFSRHIVLQEPTTGRLLSLTGATLGLAYISWRYVEQPFRQKDRLGRRNIFALAIVCSIILFGFGLIGYKTDGFVSRLSGDRGDYASYFENSVPAWKYFEREKIQQHYRDDCNFYDSTKYRIGAATQAPRDAISADCYTPNSPHAKKVFIWGDSHAQQFNHGLQRNLPAEWQVMQVASSGCSARLNATPNKKDYCEYSNWFAIKSISETKPDVVIVGQQDKHSIETMATLSSALSQLGVGKVIFTGPTPHWRADLPSIVIHKLWDNTPRRTFTGLDKSFIKQDQQLKSNFKTGPGSIYVSVIDYFCDKEGCLIFTGNDRKSGITSWDYGHLTPVASDLFARDVLAALVTQNKWQRTAARAQ
jgi:peptidoglycan/LPS O-acetylase OafA/YrhL